MQNFVKHCQNEDYIDYEPVEFDLEGVEVPATTQPTSKSARNRRFLPGLKAAVVFKLMSVQPSKVAIALGQGIGYVLVGVLVLVGQVVWFFVQMVSAFLSILVRTLVHGGQESLSEYMSRRRDKDKDIDWRDIPIGQGRRTKTRGCSGTREVSDRVEVDVHVRVRK